MDKKIEDKIVKKEVTENKTLTYKKGDMKINLTFRTDIKQQMKDLVELLDSAKEDIQIILGNYEK